MAVYAIGDIQGCYQELRALLELIQFSPSTDRLWIAGDLVNRGPQSLEVLTYLSTLDGAVDIVLGNHDLHLLAIAHGARPCGKKDTLNAIFNSRKKQSLLDWLRLQPLIVTDHTRRISMTHAGIPPIWSIADAHNFADEVATMIQGTDSHLFFNGMYGNTPEQWHENLAGIDRLRVITNYLTRMRFCTAEGQLDLLEKANRTSTRSEYKAWYQHDNPAIDAKHEIIFGHWAALEGRSDSPRHHALDTGCVWQGSLTAMNIDTKERHCVAAMH